MGLSYVDPAVLEAVTKRLDRYLVAPFCAWCGHLNHRDPGTCMVNIGGASPEPCGCQSEELEPLVGWCARCFGELRRGDETASIGADEDGIQTLICARCAAR